MTFLILHTASTSAAFQPLQSTHGLQCLVLYLQPKLYGAADFKRRAVNNSFGIESQII